jgi:hypothetical protein
LMRPGWGEFSRPPFWPALPTGAGRYPMSLATSCAAAARLWINSRRAKLQPHPAVSSRHQKPRADHKTSWAIDGRLAFRQSAL